jgi:hypothetical protein
MMLSYALGAGLGFARTVDKYTNDDGKDTFQEYRNMLYLGIGMDGCATSIALLFVRVPKDPR